MVSMCPNEADPRPLVSAFVSDPEVNVLPGLVSEGLESLMDLVESEISKQNPGARTLIMSKESMLDNRVLTTNDLRKYLAAQDWNGLHIIIMRDDISIIRWTEAFEELRGKDVTLFIGERGCRAIPFCRKLVRPFSDR